LLGYYSTNLKMDGRLRKIEVKVKPPGLTVRARRGYVAPNEAALRASASATKSAASAPALVDDALGTLARLRPSSELFIYGTPDSTGVSVVVEIAAAQMASGRWNSGGEVQVVVTSQSGDTVGTAQGRIEPGARGTLMRVPLAAPVGGALRVAAKVGTGSVSLEDRGEIRQAAGRVLGEPLLFRGTPAATSALRAVADFQYRRTERAHIEWPILAPLDRRDARLLGRNGQPLTVPVTVTERESNGRAVLAADVNLAPLTEGDYVIEITVGSGAETEQKRVAIRVKT
jgi:hypothetical protein